MAADDQLGELAPVFRWAQANDAGISQSRLYQWLGSGLIERVGHGLYLRSDAPAVDLDLIEVAIAAPEATLCLASALARHDLIDEIPSEIHLALPKNRNRPKLSAPVRWHHFDTATFAVGRGELEVAPGFNIWLYDAPRSIVDAYRLRHLEGHEMAREALRAWIQREGSQPSTLLQIAERFPKARTSLRNDLEVLL
jgi:predicted transcriptional regulator of viral defense system